MTSTSDRTPTDTPPTRKTAIGIVLTRVGIAMGFGIAALYAVGGSSASALAFSAVPISILGVHLFLPQHIPLAKVANALSVVIWCATLVVGLRTGGPESPIVLWNFFPPITTYVLAGRRSAMTWALLSGIQIVIFNVVDRLGHGVSSDLTGTSAAVHRTAVFIIGIVTVGLIITGGESHRAATQERIDEANRTLERQRLLGDMHDGVGTQLLGLMMQVRAKRIDDERLLQGLGSALDDLKLIVDSLDPEERPFETAVADLRSRLEPRCEAADVALTWNISALTTTRPTAEQTLQVLRALQEAVTNALRHARTDRLDVTIEPDRSSTTLVVRVRDYGTGFDPATARAGRGLASLRARAQRLGGTLTIEPAEPGSAMTLRFPLSAG